MIQVLKRKEKWNGLPTVINISPIVDMYKMNLYIYNSNKKESINSMENNFDMVYRCFP